MEAIWLWISSVKINSEGDNGDKEIFFNDTDSCNIICLFIPALSRANLDALIPPLPCYRLDAKLIPWVFVEIFKS